jgi:DNA polymerase I-like protein with 3'-5' exonuclease and polymerase domains
MRTVLDVENNSLKRDGKTILDPWEPGNHLVQVGTLNVDNPKEMHLLTFDHKEHKDTGGVAAFVLQAVLDETTLLILHSARHDMPWLWESGFKYDGAIYDTMIGEYLLLRGVKKKISLEKCAEDRQLTSRKLDTLKEYYKKGYNTDEIPLAELTEYLASDLKVTRELFLAQEQDYSQPDTQSMINVRDISMKVCMTLCKMYQRGFKVDRNALEQVRQEFEQEKAELETRINVQVRKLMGDTPINMNSPEQKSQVIYSMKPNTKKEWAELFEYVNDQAEYRSTVNANTTRVYKTQAFTCPTCEGTGYTYKLKKDLTRYAKPNKCKDCAALGYQLKETKELAGLKFFPPNKEWVSDSGFSTSKGNLELLIATAKTKGMLDAVQFLSDLQRLNAITSYLNNFVGGIDIFTKPDGFLHVDLSQTTTATGRFSGRNPNMQNMPRGNTFPVKKVFVSRWDGGYIMEADFAQLEFRVAAFLSQDKTAMDEIATGFDVHSYTAKVITDAGEPTTRQEAKEHTFAPLFGATGYGRSKAVAAYYEHFTEKYTGVARWHKKLGKEAVNLLKITNVSGRQYAFPECHRRENGSISHMTNIKNYPVQGFATGDIVPVVLMELEERLKPLQSCLVNTVHDSAVIDIHPNEKEYVIAMIDTLNQDLSGIIEEAYNIQMNVPLLLEAKIGPNWLDTKDV